MAVAWVSEFDTGISEIDEQHKILLNYINQLAESFDRDSADRVLADLTDFTSLHFVFEQHVLEQAG